MLVVLLAVLHSGTMRGEDYEGGRLVVLGGGGGGVSEITFLFISWRLQRAGSLQ